MKPAPRQRLDHFLVEKGLVDSAAKARAVILTGKVLVNGKTADKAGSAVPEDAEVEIIDGKNPYVSRGGLKLKAALDHFGWDALAITDPKTCVALDVGASTGGFTDCLLQAGFLRVHAADVGYGQLDFKLRNDPRVKVYERVNIRELKPEQIGESVNLIVIDVSFISILKFIDQLRGFLAPEGRILAMVKPQFEAGRKEVSKGRGVIRSEEVIAEILEKFRDAVTAAGFAVMGFFASPVHGAKGNREVFCLMKEAV